MWLNIWLTSGSHLAWFLRHHTHVDTHILAITMPSSTISPLSSDQSDQEYVEHIASPPKSSKVHSALLFIQSCSFSSSTRDCSHSMPSLQLFWTHLHLH